MVVKWSIFPPGIPLLFKANWHYAQKNYRISNQPLLTAHHICLSVILLIHWDCWIICLQIREQSVLKVLQMNRDIWSRATLHWLFQNSPGRLKNKTLCRPLVNKMASPNSSVSLRYNLNVVPNSKQCWFISFTTSVSCTVNIFFPSVSVSTIRLIFVTLPALLYPWLDRKLRASKRQDF